MYPAAFDYYRASSIPEAIKLLQEHPDAKLLAGGHSLLPAMKLRLSEPAALIDISRIADLAGVQDAGDRIIVGATTTYWQLMQSEVIRQSLPLLAEASGVVGDIQVRNRGTIGGALAHADPASDMPAAVLALDASIKAVGAGTYAKRASATEQALAGQAASDQAIERAASHAAEGLDLNGDIFASEEYRAHLTRVLTQRALARAVAAARG
ncbi:MAG: FAD binding domain-containing protein [Sphaerobacter sp.]|nr:FAD binding domain-containing protein [Sphaerobacter sp.]